MFSSGVGFQYSQHNQPARYPNLSYTYKYSKNTDPQSPIVFLTLTPNHNTPSSLATNHGPPTSHRSDQ